MEQKKNQKDVLIVRDEKTGEISVVAGLKKDGTPKTTAASGAVLINVLYLVISALLCYCFILSYSHNLICLFDFYYLINSAIQRIAKACLIRGMVFVPLSVLVHKKFAENICKIEAIPH